MIAFHFPPFAGSSGVQRTLRFCQYLPKYGWLPTILSANPRAYEKRSDDLISEIPKEVKTTRAFALDSARHMSINGRHIQLLAMPDRWVSWMFGAIPAGYRLIKKNQPDLIWSTYPLATTHLIAYFLHKITGLPWVADFRDPMVEQDSITHEWFPDGRLLRLLRLFIEKRATLHAARLVFCTEGARKICMERYPACNHDNWHVITNGFDEETFLSAELELPSCTNKNNNNQITLLHSGILYDSEDRDPRSFFEAISQLKHEGKIDSKSFQVKLRACGNEDIYSSIARENNIDDIILFMPMITYKEAIKEILTVDGLLIFQGYTSNPAVPAKLYEYLRAKRPIFALADSEGDTAKLLGNIGMDYIVPLKEVNIIKAKLMGFIEQCKAGSIRPIPNQVIMQYSRQHTTKKLAELLDNI